MSEPSPPKPPSNAFVVPDLESRSATPSVREVPAVRLDPNACDYRFDDGSLAEVDLELALDPEHGRPVAFGHAADGRSATMPESVASAADRERAVVLAEYGAPPKSPYLMPVYALRVFKRRRELEAQLASLETQASAAERASKGGVTTIARERIEAHRRALRAYDGPAVEQGVKLAATLLGLGALILLLRLLL